MTTPVSEYNGRLAQRQGALRRQERRSGQIANARLVAFGGAVALAVASLAYDVLPAAWTLLPLGAFVVLVVLHDHVIRAEERARAAVRYYHALLDRLDHRWAGKGIQRTDFVPDSHPYANDLDIFGTGSLFELLCAARTRAGEHTLARWLTETPDVAEIRDRQAAVGELCPRLDLREDLALLAGGVQAEVEPEALVAWGQAPARFSPGATRWLHLLAGTLTAGAVAAAAGWGWGLVGPLPLFGILGVQWVVRKLLQPRIQAVLSTIARPERELRVIAGVLGRLEQESLGAGRNAALQATLGRNGSSASRVIHRLDRLVAAADNQRNAFFAPLGFVLMWPVHFALRIEAWRARWGRDVGAWLESIGELEALSSLAAYAFENPEDPFPELVEDGPIYDGEELGHPLLPAAACVRNSVELDRDVQAWVVSGSNMSGKSTLLRTVGINAVLAHAGGPVRAARLTLCPLSIGATIRIHDSLREGSSRFYAEIKRLKQLTDLTRGPHPLLFLLDEILHGTNSHDRQIGARALLAELVRSGAIGLMTTHDLALAAGSDSLDGRLKNVHFSDRLEDGELVFDYKVRPGVVQGSNAIELMRSVGLEI